SDNLRLSKIAPELTSGVLVQYSPLELRLLRWFSKFQRVGPLYNIVDLGDIQDFPKVCNRKTFAKVFSFRYPAANTLTFSTGPSCLSKAQRSLELIKNLASSTLADCQHSSSSYLYMLFVSSLASHLLVI
ncbi:hypothetical protein AOQ84DRAFT_415045, partial [Glonium stellatum]